MLGNIRGETLCRVCEQNENRASLRRWPSPISTSSTRSSGAPSSTASARGDTRRRPAAGHRRRRLGQDQHARPSRRASDRQRRRPAPHPAADLLAPRRRRDDAPRRAHRRAGARRPSAGAMTDALTWAGTFHGIGARLLREYAAADRPRPGLHHPRPRGLRRPDEPGPPRARLLEDGEPLSRPRAPASPSTRAPSTPRRRSTRCSAQSFPGAPAGRPSCASCSPPMSRPSSARTCSITTTCCSTGRR